MREEQYKCSHGSEKIRKRCTHCGAPATSTLTITDRNLLWAHVCDKCYKEIYEEASSNVFR